MDFNLSEEQRLLQNSIDRFLADNYGFLERGKLVYSERGYSDSHWQLFADMGWLGLPFDPDYGGYGGTAVDVAIVMESLGGALVLEPYLSTVVIGGGLIANAGSEDQKSTLIPQIIAGDLTLAFAYLEPQSRFNPADIETRAVYSDEAFVLSGSKSVVYQGRSADKIIVSARSHGASTAQEGISLFLLDQGMPGVSRKDFKTLDGQWGSDFQFTDVKLDASALLGAQGQSFSAIESTLACVISAVCAEAVGAMASALSITQEYIQVREQFGAPIGSFQALQHRWVDMHIEAEMAKSMSDVLAMRLRDGDGDSSAMVAATKIRVGKAALAVGQGAIQLHGGIGMTDECSIGHYYKRLLIIELLFGTQDYHACRYEQLQTVA
jgi:alkylation response protein AidB-like acyl-CoA dehydrogenase